MFKLIIADDEPTEIKFIHFVINTFKLPFHICGEAENGEEALQLVHEHSPEFVILDIQMPLMDGLTAASLIKKDHPMTKVYLLTAYELFEYAQKAVKADVDDYLLKPIKPEALADALNKGIAQILEQQLADRELDDTKQNIENMKPLLKRQFILDLVTAGNTDLIPMRLKEAFGLRKIGFQGILVATLFDKRGKADTREMLQDILVKGFEDQCDFGLCEILPSGDLVALVHKWDEKTQQLLNQSIKSNVRDLEIEVYSGFVPLNEQSHTPSAFVIADKIRRTALFWRIPGNFLMTELGSIQDCLPNVVEVEKKVLNGLLERRVEKAQESIKEAFQNTSCRFISPEQVIAVANQIVNVLMIDLSEQILSESETRIIAHQYFEKIASARSYSELENILFGLIDYIYNLLCLKNETQTEQAIKWAASFIRQNYHEEITLDQMASKLFLSPSYFSRMFKKYVGDSFATFIINVRMEHAQNFLATGKFSVAQVAKKVGFCNSGYFSTVYKRHFGMSPQQTFSVISH